MQVPQGGWFPLAVAAVVMAVAATWYWASLLRLRHGLKSSQRLVEELMLDSDAAAAGMCVPALKN